MQYTYEYALVKEKISKYIKYQISNTHGKVLGIWTIDQLDFSIPVLADSPA